MRKVTKSGIKTSADSTLPLSSTISDLNLKGALQIAFTGFITRFR
jgi:hypothetical protein